MIIFFASTYLQLGATSHHLGEGNAHTLDDGQQHCATNSTIPRRLVTSSDSQGATCEKTGDDGIVWILLLADALDGAVKGREQTTPDTKVTTQDGGSHLDGSNGAYPSLAVRGVSVALDTVPYRTTDGLLEGQEKNGESWSVDGDRGHGV